MLAGVWVLVSIPLLDVLRKTGGSSLLRLPAFLDDGPVTLNDAFVYSELVHPHILFCIGVVLLFSKERGRRSNRWDWTRRWGIIGCYMVAVLSAGAKLYLPAVDLAQMSAMFLGMPLKFQPEITETFVLLGTSYLRYGPTPGELFCWWLIAFSSVTMLLACVPLSQALRSTGRRILVKILPAPLALFSLIYIAEAAWVLCGHLAWARSVHSEMLGSFFQPSMLLATWKYPLNVKDFLIELVKWLTMFTLALRLTFAQLRARRKTTRRNSAGHAIATQ